MLAKIILVACFIGLARSGALHNAAHGGYNGLAGNGNYGAYRLAGNLGYSAGLAGNVGYGANPALGGATSYVNIVKEISNRGAYGPDVTEYNDLAGYRAAGYNSGAGWRNPGYAGLAGAGLPRSGGLGTYAGAGYPHGGAHSSAVGPLAGAAGNGGAPTSYSNIYNGPLRIPLLGNGVYGPGAAGYGGYGYGNGQVW